MSNNLNNLNDFNHFKINDYINMIYDEISHLKIHLLDFECKYLNIKDEIIYNRIQNGNIITHTISNALKNSKVYFMISYELL